MTNEEKAIQFATDSKGNILAYAHMAALGMALWKDEQFAAEKKVLIEKACEVYKKDLLQCQRIISNIRKTAENIIDIEGSVCDFRKAMDETK